MGRKLTADVRTCYLLTSDGLSSHEHHVPEVASTKISWFSSIMICGPEHRGTSGKHQCQTVKALKADTEHGVVKHQQFCRSMLVASHTVSQQMNLASRRHCTSMLPQTPHQDRDHARLLPEVPPAAPWTRALARTKKLLHQSNMG